MLHVEDIARHQNRIQREYPLVAHMPDGTLVEGRADMVIDTDDGWIVVDYKTGRDSQHARSQVQIYCYALQQATGRKASGLVIRI